MSLVKVVAQGELIQPLARGAKTLYLDLDMKARLHEKMKDGDYTYGSIFRGRSKAIEVVKITARGGLFHVERGLDGTDDQAHPVGSCIDTRITHAWVEEYLCLQQP